MALTLPRWLLAVVAACALMAVGLLGGFIPVPSLGTYTYLARLYSGPDSAKLVALRAESDSLEGVADLIALRLRELQIRDSLSSTIRATADTGLTIRIDPAITLSLQARLHVDALAAWAAASSSKPGTPVVAAMVLDTGSRILGRDRRRPGAVRLYEFLPSGVGRQPCLAVTALGDPDAMMDPRSQPNAARSNYIDPELFRARLLGPCAYLAAFGTPGPEVEAWLESNSLFAQESRWAQETPPIIDDPRFLVGTYSANSWISPLQALFASWTSSPARRYLGNDGRACDAGDTERCEEAVLGSAFPGDVRPGASALSLARAESKRLNAANPYRRGYYEADRLGPSETSFLADMVHDFGPAKFAAFWHSTKSVPVAFHDATQESLGDWTRDWVQRIYGTTTVGPFAPPSATIEALIFGAIAVAVAMWVGVRRQAG